MAQVLMPHYGTNLSSENNEKTHKNHCLLECQSGAVLAETSHQLSSISASFLSKDFIREISFLSKTILSYP